MGIQVVLQTFKQWEIHFGYPKVHLVSHISDRIWRAGSGENFTKNLSELLHIGNTNEVDQSTNNVNYIRQVLQRNDWSTNLDCMEETLTYLVLQG